MTTRLRKTNIIRNRQQTRARLLQATVALAVDGRARGISMKQVARRANLSRGVAYQHFKDRDHMLREAKQWISDRLADSVKKIGVLPLEERVRNSAKVMLDNSEAAKLLIADALSGEDGHAHQRLFNIALRTLKRFKASGVLRADIDAEVFAYISLASNVAVLMLHNARESDGADVTADRFAKEWVALLRKGLFSERTIRRRSTAERGPSGREAAARRGSKTRAHRAPASRSA